MKLLGKSLSAENGGETQGVGAGAWLHPCLQERPGLDLGGGEAGQKLELFLVSD